MRPRYPRLLQDSLTISAAQNAEKTAVVTADERVSYAELHARASRFASLLQEVGVRRGDRVAIFLENSVDTVAGIYGALYAGAAFMVVNPQTKEDKLHYMLADSGASAVLSEGRLARMVSGLLADPATALPDLLALVLTGGVDEAVAPRADEASGGPGSSGPNQDAEGLAAGSRSAVDGRFTVRSLGAWTDTAVTAPGTVPLDLAALVYTSGSTGNPKGVMLSHQNMVFAQGSLVEYLRLDASDRILNLLPLAFDYGLYQALMAVHLGATLVLERTFAFPAAIVKRVVEEGVTVFPGVPTVFATLLSLHRNVPIAMPSVRRYTNTAAHLPDEYVPGLLEMSPGALVYKMYGLTECKRVCYLEPELVLAKPLSVGRAIPGTETYLLGEDGQPVGPGVTGTLYVRGPHVMLGYWNLPAETEHMLKPGKYPGERVLCTHDWFRTDEGGFLYFMGRSDDIIKSRGEKVSPVEVENALATIPGVREAAVIGVPDELLGQAVRAYVVLDPGASYTEQAFKREAMARLESFMVPRDVRFVDDLPKTATGKVRKKSLVEQA
ncbi:MAG: acyl--CoA ligase [Trueperaceae bacterium]|nr:acyl--CoA ligase [Trueperaceae bacterium]MCW5818333.1 acyl--CoA ligase [Trueperaceae bacterium]